MSRITSDSVNPLLRPLRWYEVIPAALHGIPPGRVRVELPPNMPEIDADPGMLERVIANIVENAVKYAPDSDIVLVGTAGGLSADHPRTGARPANCASSITARASRQKASLQCSGPSSASTTSRRPPASGSAWPWPRDSPRPWAERLTAEQTPGGGLTMVIRLPLSTGVAFDRRQAAQAPLEPQSALLARRTHAPRRSVSRQGRSAMTAVLVVDDDPHLLRP